MRPGRSKKSSEQAIRPLRSVLVPIDLTALSDRVLARLALLPLAGDARLTLLHVVPGALSSREQRAAARDAGQALAEEVRQLREALPGRSVVEPVVKVGAAAREIAASAKATRCELILMGRGGGRRGRDVVLGSTAERVIRQVPRPVLAVRLPARTAYRRPGVALDFDRAASDVLRMLLRIVPAPRPRIGAIHVFDLPFGPAYPSLLATEIEKHETELEREASVKLVKLLIESLRQANLPPDQTPRFRPQVRRGSPRSLIPRVVKRAEIDLLALGTQGRSGLGHVFLGTVAGDVLREVACDVLVVPPRARA